MNSQKTLFAKILEKNLKQMCTKIIMIYVILYYLAKKKALSAIYSRSTRHIFFFMYRGAQWDM